MVTNTLGKVRSDAKQREGPTWGAIAYLLTMEQNLVIMYFSLSGFYLFLDNKYSQLPFPTSHF